MDAPGGIVSCEAYLHQLIGTTVWYEGRTKVSVLAGKPSGTQMIELTEIAFTCTRECCRNARGIIFVATHAVFVPVQPLLRQYFPAE